MGARVRLRKALVVSVTAAGLSVGVTLASGAAAMASAAEGSIRGATAPNAIKGQYIVVLKDAVAAAAGVETLSKTMTRRYGGTATHTYSAALRGFATRMTEPQARRLAADRDVAYIEQDQTMRADDTQSGATWGLDRIDQRAYPLDNTYRYQTPTQQVWVYVIDTGVRITHSEFAGRASSGRDFIDGDSDAQDCNGHGTHVAGTIAGKTYGVAKKASIVAVRVLNCYGSGSTAGVVAGVDWVTRNAKRPAVANMSLGGGPSSALDNAVANSIASRVTYAVAAGNENQNACYGSPARTPAAITVGATGAYGNSNPASDTRASFSNYGTCVDLFAPGVGITSAVNTSDTALGAKSGTSMATPHVAGAAAVYLGANPAAIPAQVRYALFVGATANVVGNAGYGSPNKLLYVEPPKATLPPTPTPTPTPPPSVACGPVSNTTVVAIPDLGMATSSATVGGCGGNASARSTVKVKITHSFRGDIELWLVAPNGAAFKLKAANPADWQADIDATYTVGLSAIARNGTWTLRAYDRYWRDSGQLTSWTLAL